MIFEIYFVDDGAEKIVNRIHAEDEQAAVDRHNSSRGWDAKIIRDDSGWHADELGGRRAFVRAT